MAPRGDHRLKLKHEPGLAAADARAERDAVLNDLLVRAAAGSTGAFETFYDATIALAAFTSIAFGMPVGVTTQPVLHPST